MNNIWKVGVAFVVVFIAGGTIGWVLTLRYVNPPPWRQPTRPENFGAQLMRRWVQANRLGLSPAQQDAIRPVVNDTAEALRRLQRDNQHRAQLLIEQMQDQVAAQLTAAQRDTFNELILAQRERMRRFLQEHKAVREQQQRP